MVNQHLLLNTLLFFCLTFTHLAANEIDVSASIETNNAFENQPLSGLITVTHSSNKTIDTNSFKIQGKPLNVELLREEKIKDLSISAFHFRLDPLPPGLYLLPSISVSIGGSTYQSSPSSYAVRHALKEISNPSKKTIFKLEAIYEGPSPLYLGDRGFLIYRIYYNTNIDLSLSQLPLLKQNDFRKIGDVQVVESQSGDLSSQEIKQEIEAIKPGTFTYGPSIIEGVTYHKNALGEKESLEKLRAEGPFLTIEVVPFPAKGVPSSFNGAVGEFSIKTALLTPTDVFVGDQIQIAIDITGKGNLSDLKIPNLLCQPGFSGLFHLSDLPPAGKVKELTKHFILTMRPKSLFIKNVPSIEFSYFDPQANKYVRLHSKPLPLNIKPLEKELSHKKQKNSELAMDEWRESLTHLPPIEIKENVPISMGNLSFNALKTLWVLLIIPFGLIILAAQIYLRRVIEAKKNLKKIISSEQLLQHALTLGSDPDKMLQRITYAFLSKLKEKNIVKEIHIPAEEIPNTGYLNAIREFLCYLEAIRYGDIKDFSLSEIVIQAQDLFKKI